MKNKVKKLTLNKETLRDLMAHNAGHVKGGRFSQGKKCRTQFNCTVTCVHTCEAMNCSAQACW